MRISLLLLFIFNSCLAFAQHSQAPKWVVPPLIIDFTTNTPTTSPIPNAPSRNYFGVNGIFDPSGNLLFYVIDDEILDANSTLVTKIDAPSAAATPVKGLAHNPMIVPVPGSCSNEYYVIYSNSGQGTTPLLFTRIQRQVNGTITVVPNNLDVVFGSAGGFINTFAMSTLRANNTRRLYNGSTGLVQVFNISNTGISLQSSSTIDFNGIGITPVELELHESTNRLAFSSFSDLSSAGTPPQGQIFLANLFGNGDLMTGLTMIPVSGINNTRGVEFTADGSQLAISGGAGSGSASAGIFSIDLTQMPAVVTPISGHLAFAASQIELGFDGRMHFADGTRLRSLDLNNPTNFITRSISNVGSDPIGVFTLPIQIDGQNYTFPEIVDLWIADGVADTGAEPNPQLSSVWEGDIWNCQTVTNCPLSNAENPEFKKFDDNYTRVTIQNRGACPSESAELRLYWTRARTGEIWDDHWLDPQLRPSNVINGCPAGGEITADAFANSIPMTIPSLASGGSVTLTHPWQPQDPKCYPTGSPGVFNNSGDPMICFLARIDSDQDPIVGEQLGNIKDNIINSNNIATRNFHLVDLSACKREVVGGSISLFNAADYPQLMNVHISDLNGDSGYPPFLETGSLRLVMNTTLWNAWVNTGMQGEGIEVVSEGVVLINNLDNAVLYDIEVGAAQGHPITLTASVPQEYVFEERITYRFLLSHTSATEPNGNSAGVYHFALSPECDLSMRSQVSVAQGECAMMGTFADEENCTFSWFPETGLSDPFSARTEVCPEANTTYTLTVIAPNGCESSSTVEVFVEEPSESISIPTSNPAADQFWLFPNPGQDAVRAEFQLDQSAEVTVSIYNQLGQVISTPHPSALRAKGYHRIDLRAQELPAGIYFCELQIGATKSTRQLLITK